MPCVKGCLISKVCADLYSGTKQPPCATNTGGTQPTDVQQLKAEIAAMCAEFISSRNGILKSGPDFRFVTKMRQLSAV